MLPDSGNIATDAHKAPHGLMWAANLRPASVLRQPLPVLGPLATCVEAPSTGLPKDWTGGWNRDGTLWALSASDYALNPTPRDTRLRCTLRVPENLAARIPETMAGSAGPDSGDCGVSSRSGARERAHMPHTVIGAWPSSGPLLKIRSFHVLLGRMSKTTKCPDSAPHRSM